MQLYMIFDFALLLLIDYEICHKGSNYFEKKTINC
jgi:hypothetical protein